MQTLFITLVRQACILLSESKELKVTINDISEQAKEAKYKTVTVNERRKRKKRSSIARLPLLFVLILLIYFRRKEQP